MDDRSSLRTRSRMAAWVIHDFLLDPPAVAADDVPWRPEAITPAWMTATLCRDVPGAEVLEVKLSEPSQGSTVRRSVEVRFNDVGEKAGLTNAFFAKATPSLVTRSLSGVAARAEFKFLHELRDQLDIEAPTLPYSASDKASGRSVQLFVDLVKTEGATFNRYTTKIERSHAEDAVDILGTLHGHFYDSEVLHRRWLGTYEQFLRGGERVGIRGGHDEAMIKAKDVIPEDVFERRDEIWPLVIKGLAVHGEGPRTLLHSDVHLGNWYITGQNRLGLADWQCVCTGHWSRDLAYSLSTLLATEDRRAWERDLIARYLERLEAEGGPKVSFDEAFRRYRQQLPAALLMWTPTLCHAPGMPDMQPEEMSMLMISRITAAMSDLDVFASHDG